MTFLLSPVSWNAAYEVDEANNGYSLTNGNFRQHSQIEFATGMYMMVDMYLMKVLYLEKAKFFLDLKHNTMGLYKGLRGKDANLHRKGRSVISFIPGPLWYILDMAVWHKPWSVLFLFYKYTGFS